MLNKCALLLAFTTALFTASCGKKSSCVEGETSSCACPQGTTGVRACDAQGEFGACDCSGSGDAGMDATGTTPNACGGTVELRFGGELASPGEACGECADGVLACEGPDSMHCVLANEPNECGGCEPLQYAVGEPCGACGDGTWACDDDGGLECQGATPENACGGCAELSDQPQFVCADGRGVFRCESADSVVCVTSGNPCGGREPLEAAPTSRCGACGDGKWACAGPDDVECDNPDAGVNACGGCTVLRHQPGTACECGTWECAGPNAVRCAGTNLCAGCGELEGSPGDRCGDDMLYACDGAEVDCVSSDRNPCGGSGALEAMPGETCGDCGDGLVVCVSPDLTACVGSSSVNACGGCGTLGAAPGTSCGYGETWRCEGERLVCVADLETNICGGTGELEHEPGTECMSCGVWSCGDDGELGCYARKDTATDETACGDCMTTCRAGQACIDSDCVADRVTDLRAGESHTCALMQSGDVFCWGHNIDGQLGQGDRSEHLVPVRVVGGAQGLDVGFRHSCVVLADGDVTCWGDNRDGQIDDSGEDHLTPTTLTFSGTVVDVAAGRRQTCVVFADGSAECRGENADGQLGNGLAEPGVSNWTAVSLDEVESIHAGDGFTCAIRSADDSVWCWGNDDGGKLGNGDSSGESPSPGEIDMLQAVDLSLTDALFNGNGRACAIRPGGALACWGDDAFGALGVDVTGDAESPVFPAVSDGDALAVNGRHSCAVSEGELYCWGASRLAGDNLGQLGRGDFQGSDVPVVVDVPGDVIAVAAGAKHTCAANAAGEVYCWGQQTNHRLADGQVVGEELIRNVPRRVVGIGPVSEVGACANDSDDDDDGTTDCGDSDCARELTTFTGTVASGTLRGRGNYFEPCAVTGTPDVAYLWSAPADGTYEVDVLANPAMSVAVGPAVCGATAPECAPTGGTTIDAVRGELYVIIVEASEPDPDPGTYELQVTEP